MRSINGASVAAIDEDDASDDVDVVGIFAAFCFADRFLSTTMNSISETIDTIEKMNTGIKPDIVDDECMFPKNVSVTRNEIMVADRAIAPLISIFFSILLLLLFLSSCIDKSAPLLSTSFIFG